MNQAQVHLYICIFCIDQHSLLINRSTLIIHTSADQNGQYHKGLHVCIYELCICICTSNIGYKGWRIRRVFGPQDIDLVHKALSWSVLISKEAYMHGSIELSVYTSIVCDLIDDPIVLCMIHSFNPQVASSRLPIYFYNEEIDQQKIYFNGNVSKGTDRSITMSYKTVCLFVCRTVIRLTYNVINLKNIFVEKSNNMNSNICGNCLESCIVLGT